MPDVELPRAEQTAAPMIGSGESGQPLPYTFTMLNTLAGAVVAIAEQAARLEEQAHTDPLTGLNNRLGLEREYKKKVDSGETNFGILVLDVNNLKGVNDSFGHATGDKLISLTGDFLNACLRRQDRMARGTEPSARIGGDEFLVIVDLNPKSDASKDLEPPARIESTITRLALNYETAIRDRHETFKSANVGLAIGGAVYAPGKTFDELYREADASMYVNKKEIKNTEQV